MRELDTVQVEQLKKIGESLSKAREEQGIPLEEVAIKTYIPLRLLQALEKAQIERLPEPVFIQGFIRRYGDALGLDGTALSKTFSIEPAAIATKPPEVESPSPTPAVANSLPELPRRVLDNVTLSMPRYVPIAILSGLAVLLLGWGAISLFNKPKSNSNSANSTNSRQAIDRSVTQSAHADKPTTSPQSASVQPSPNAAQPKFAEPPSLAEAPVQAMVELTGESWMQITVDGKQEYEGTAKKGYKKTWAAKRSLVIQVGNAGAVSVAYNHGEAKTLGALGEVKELAFPPEAAPSGQAAQ